MSALVELGQAVGDLDQTLRDLDGALLGPSLVDHDERQHLGTLRHSVASVCGKLIPEAIRANLTHDARVLTTAAPLTAGALAVYEEFGGDLEAAVAAMAEDAEEAEAALRRLSEALENDDSREALVAAFRYVIYEIRSLQDVLYRIAYKVMTGARPKRGKTMSAVINEQSSDPVRNLWAGDAEEYVSWLKGWRTLRDGVKRGRGVAIAGPGGPDALPDNYGITLTDTSEGGGIVVDCSRATRVSDVAHALELSCDVAKLVLTEIRRRADDPEWRKINASKSAVPRFADFLALVYHEARNVRHLIKAGAVNREQYRLIVNSLPANRQKAWAAIQDLRLTARGAATAMAAVDVFVHRFGLTLEDLENLYANSAWRDYADAYGGTAWRVIVKDVMEFRDALERGDVDRARELLVRIPERGHNTEPVGGVAKKLAHLDAALNSG